VIAQCGLGAGISAWQFFMVKLLAKLKQEYSARAVGFDPGFFQLSGAARS
jgi:hypothetical protein